MLSISNFGSSRNCQSSKMHAEKLGHDFSSMPKSSGMKPYDSSRCSQHKLACFHKCTGGIKKTVNILECSYEQLQVRVETGNDGNFLSGCQLVYLC